MYKSKAQFKISSIIIALMCLIVIVSSICCDELTTEQKRRNAIVREFRRIFEFDKTDVSIETYSGFLFAKGGIKVQNTSGFNWKDVVVIINPENEGLNEIEFKFNEVGFRAPKDKSKVFIELSIGELYDLKYDEFVHTETGEKFNLDRYELMRIYISFYVEYKGERIFCSNTFKFLD